MPWPHSGPRRASINSFGFGGANAHVILEDAASFLSRHGLEGHHATTPCHDDSDSMQEAYYSDGSSSFTSGEPNEVTSDVSSEVLRDINPQSRLFVLSSNDQDGIKRNVERLQSYLASKTSTAPSFLNDLALTLSSKRTTLPWKSYAVGASISDLREKLSTLAPVVRSSSSAVPRVAFVFTGQGAQWHSMGKGLSVYTTFAKSMERSEILLKSFGCSWSLAEELSRTEATCKLRETDYSQPACTAIQVALVDLLLSVVIPAARSRLRIPLAISTRRLRSRSLG
jgi:acyl transferase domain-containing protein